MPFSGDGRRLTGNLGRLFTGSAGAEIEGDGIALLAVGIYAITGIGNPTGIPEPTTYDAILKKYLIFSDGTLVLETGDKVVPISLDSRCDITEFSIEASQAEVDTSTLCDAFKVYEKGQTDISGSLTGLFEIGKIDGENSFNREFIDIVKQDEMTSVDLLKRESLNLYGMFMSNFDPTVGDYLFTFAPINVFGTTLGSNSIDAAQQFTGNLRFRNDLIVTPAQYRWTVDAEAAFTEAQE